MKTGKEKLIENGYDEKSSTCSNCIHCFSSSEIDSEKSYFCTLNETPKPTRIPDDIEQNGYLYSIFNVLESQISIDEALVRTGWYKDDEEKELIEKRIEDKKRDLDKNRLDAVIEEWSWFIPRVNSYGTCDRFENC
jgi:hypothetical protein